MAPRIALVSPVPDAVAARAAREFDAVLSQDGPMSMDEVQAVVKEPSVAGLMFSTRLPMNAAAVAALPRHLKVLATCSVGYDHIDLAAAAAHNLVVTNTPEVLTEATADFAFMLILCATRRASEYDAIVRAGWGHRYELNEMLGMQITGKVLGIYGMGRVGRAVATRARAFGMKIVYHDIAELPADLAGGAGYFADLRAMLPHCNVLSLHAPGGAATSRIINGETLALLPKGAVLVNAGRGNQVDENALIAALKSGHIAAAGLDVFWNEPNIDKRFCDLPNVFLTPHMASATVETRTAMGMRALDNIAAVLAGRPPMDPVIVPK